jgi:hypothetical protein
MAHRIGVHDHEVTSAPGLYTIRIKGRLGATALSAFPSMVSELKDDETVLTGSLQDRSALFGVLAQVEALGLDLLELTQIHAGAKPPGGCSPRAREMGESPESDNDAPPARP